MRGVRPGRVRDVLLASAALIGAAVALSGLFAGWFFEGHVLAQEEAHTAALVRAQAQQHFDSRAFAWPQEPAQAADFQVFLEGLPGVFRVKVFAPDGRIVWSDEPRLIGRSFPDNAHVTAAMAGRVVTVLETPRRPEHLYERAKEHVAQAYVPIALPGGPGVVGVVETYKDVTDVVAGIRRARRVIWAGAGGIGGLLYLALAAVVWRAWVNERRAVDRLELQNQALRQAQIQLIEKERLAAVGEVVVGLHHAILNPLTGILGAIQVLKRDGDVRPETSEALTTAEREIRRVERIVRGLPALRQTTGTPYVGGTRMLDLEHSRGGPPDGGHG